MRARPCGRAPTSTRSPACTLALEQRRGSLLCLHRRLRGAAVGHLAAIEVTSSLPCRQLRPGTAPARPVAGDDGRTSTSTSRPTPCTSRSPRRDICAALVEQEPGLAEDVSFGVAVSLLMDELLAEHVLGCFRQGRSSLRAKTVAGAVA